MTCNGGLFLTIIVGLSLGHFLWKSRRPMPTDFTGRGTATAHAGESSETCCLED